MNKQFIISAAALFLFAAPVPGFAQSTDDGTAASGTTKTDGTTTTGGSSTTTGAAPSTAGSGNNNSTGTDNNNTAQSDDSGPNCGPVQAGRMEDSFSERCRNEIDSWVNAQAGASVVYDGDVAVGTVLPDSVEFTEVPAYRGYGYARLNDRRVLVDRDTRTVVRVY